MIFTLINNDIFRRADIDVKMQTGPVIACCDAGWQLLQLGTPSGFAWTSPVGKKVERAKAQARSTHENIEKLKSRIFYIRVRDASNAENVLIRLSTRRAVKKEK